MKVKGRTVPSEWSDPRGTTCHHPNDILSGAVASGLWILQLDYYTAMVTDLEPSSPPLATSLLPPDWTPRLLNLGRLLLLYLSLSVPKRRRGTLASCCPCPHVVSFLGPCVPKGLSSTSPAWPSVPGTSLQLCQGHSEILNLTGLSRSQPEAQMQSPVPIWKPV